ncbi:hypothetical protein, partial [Burkholderia multivorans]|uniref:hypothetical protein n=1 Tax=Burkholderia multivorans TaxID=87883 RepID=UPI001C2201F7
MVGNSDAIGMAMGFSDVENRLVIDAALSYGDYSKHAFETVDALMGLVFWPTVPCEVFLRFLAQMKKSLLLCVVSVIRRHRMQGMMNLRYFLETTSHAAYGLAHKDPASYLKKGEIDAPKVISGKAYKWLELEHPAVSKEIKRMKDEVDLPPANRASRSLVKFVFGEEDEHEEALYGTANHRVSEGSRGR